MNKSQRKTLLLVVVIALLAISTTLAAAKELNSLSISGPGIKGQMTLNDPDGMRRLEEAGFFDQSSLIKAPANLGEGYTMTVHLNLDGKIVPMIQMVYYPGEVGQIGYMHITGRLNGNSMQTADDWSTVPAKAGNVLRDLTAAQGITLQTAVMAASVKAPVAESATSSTSTSTSPNTAYIALAVAGGLILLLVAGLVARRRAVHHAHAPSTD